MKHSTLFFFVVLFFAGVTCPLHISAQWKFLGSPQTCKSLDVAIEGDTIVLLTSGGLFYSTDDAASWHNIPGPSNVYHEETIQIEKGILYLTSTGGEIIQDTLRYLTEILRSDDWGARWHTISGVLDYHLPFQQLLVKSDTVYLIDKSNIWVSYDRGDNYSIQSPALDLYSNYYMLNHALYGKVNLDDHQILLKSSDDAQSWDTLYISNTGWFVDDINSIDGILWKIEYRPSYHSCYGSKSPDDGVSWIPTDTIPNLQIGFFDNLPREIFGGDDNLFILFDETSARLYYSNDAGKTFIKETHFPSSKYPFYVKGRLILTGTSLFESHDNGETLEEITNSLEGATVNNIAATADMMWANANYSVHSKSIQSSIWQELTGFEQVVSSDDGYLLAIINRSAYRSVDQGQNWILITAMDLGQDLPFPIFEVACAGGKMFIWDSSRNLYYSTDHGVKWKLSDKTDAYVLSYNGKYIVSDNFGFASSDDGIHWSELPATEDPYFTYSCDGTYYLKPYFYVCADTTLLRIHEDSSTWEKIRIPVPHVFHTSQTSIPVFSIASYEGLLLISFFGHGVFGSSDFGQTWYEINEGLTNYKTVSLSVKGTDLFLGVDGGVWKRPLNDLTVALQEPEQLRESYFAIAPNLVSEGLTISFNQDEFENGNIDIFSSDGTLQSTFSVKASSDIYLPTNMLPAGLYIISYRSDTQTETHSFIKM